MSPDVGEPRQISHADDCPCPQCRPAYQQEMQLAEAQAQETTHEAARHTQLRLQLIPMTLAEANEFVALHHRHHRPVVGHKFSIGVVSDQQLRGVVIVGRPIARGFDDGDTLEVVRTATDGTPNANSMLYGAAQRATFALGYRRLITYIRTDESGASLRASNWKVIGRRKARSWELESRVRIRTDKTEPFERFCWEVTQ